MYFGAAEKKEDVELYELMVDLRKLRREDHLRKIDLPEVSKVVVVEQLENKKETGNQLTIAAATWPLLRKSCLNRNVGKKREFSALKSDLKLSPFLFVAELHHRKWCLDSLVTSFAFDTPSLSLPPIC